MKELNVSPVAEFIENYRLAVNLIPQPPHAKLSNTNQMGEDL
jgi:hypothetical protein